VRVRKGLEGELVAVADGRYGDRWGTSEEGKWREGFAGGGLGGEWCGMFMF
jgi:hypothetical protein